MYDLVVENARIYPMTADLAPAAERSFAVRDGRVVDLGADGPARERVDARGRCVLPGFIDCHTHALYAGDRLDEHVRKLGGATYEEISRARLIKPTSEVLRRKLVWSHPAFANRCIYARNDEEIICVSLAKKQ